MSNPKKKEKEQKKKRVEREGVRERDLAPEVSHLLDDFVGDVEVEEEVLSQVAVGGEVVQPHQLTQRGKRGQGHGERGERNKSRKRKFFYLI